MKAVKIAAATLVSIFTARRYSSAGYSLSSCVRPFVCLPVCPSVTNRYCIERTGRIELFLARMLPSTYPTLCCKEIWVSPKLGYLPLELCAKLRTWKISPRQVDRVVNKTRRRRRSSLLTTPIRQSTSRGCLLQVGQL